MKQCVYYLLVSIFFLSLTACKSDTPAPETLLVIKVVDANNTERTFSGTDVYLFDTEDSFRNYISGNTVSYLKKGTTNDVGEYTFDNLNAGQKYYFYVVNTSLSLSNISEDGEPRNYTISGGLRGQATTIAQVELQGFVKREIKFYSSDPNVIGNNIEIYSSANTASILHTLTSVGDGSSSDQGPSTFIYAPLVDATYTYYIKNEDGCVWTKQIIITESQPEINIELEACGETTFSFYYTGSISNGNSIKVYLNNETTPVGTITSNGSCSNNNINVTRPSGTYTYKAEHSNGNCSWVGETTNSCIELLLCD